MRRITTVMASPIRGSAMSKPERDDGGARHDGKADEGIDARMGAVGHQRRAADATTRARPDTGGNLDASDSVPRVGAVRFEGR